MLPGKHGTARDVALLLLAIAIAYAYSTIISNNVSPHSTKLQSSEGSLTRGPSSLYARPMMHFEPNQIASFHSNWHAGPSAFHHQIRKILL